MTLPPPASTPNPTKISRLIQNCLLQILSHRNKIPLILPKIPMSIASIPTSESPLQLFAAVLRNARQIDKAFPVWHPSTNLDSPSYPRRIHCPFLVTCMPLATRKTAAGFTAARHRPLDVTPPSSSTHLLRPSLTSTSTATSSFLPLLTPRSRPNVSMTCLHLLLRLHSLPTFPTSMI